MIEILRLISYPRLPDWDVLKSSYYQQKALFEY